MIPESYLIEVANEEKRVLADVLSPRRLDSRHVLVVGGGGYLGPIITHHLLEVGYRVRTVDAFLYHNQATVLGFLGHPRFEMIKADLCDQNAVAGFLDGITDVVILAGLVGDPITKKYPEDSEAVNRDGMLRFVDSLSGRRLNKVIFISTCSNYGLIKENELADENFALTPLSLYAKAKVAIEESLFSKKGKVDYIPVVLRFATAFGLAPRMRFDLTVSQFTREMFLKRDLLVYDPATWRPYCHARDFAEVIGRVFAAPAARVAFDVFNAGGDVNNYTKQMIVDAIREFIPDTKVAFQEHGSDPRNYRVDFRRIRERLYFEPRMTVVDGVRELIAALQAGFFADADERPNFYGNYVVDAFEK